jgi:hypothetical protein
MPSLKLSLLFVQLGNNFGKNRQATLMHSH